MCPWQASQTVQDGLCDIVTVVAKRLERRFTLCAAQLVGPTILEWVLGHSLDCAANGHTTCNIDCWSHAVSFLWDAERVECGVAWCVTCNAAHRGHSMWSTGVLAVIVKASTVFM